jgi:competence protein ComEC
VRALVLGFAAGVGWLQTRAELPGALLLLGLCMAGILLCGIALRMAAASKASSSSSPFASHSPFALSSLRSRRIEGLRRSPRPFDTAATRPTQGERGAQGEGKTNFIRSGAAYARPLLRILCGAILGFAWAALFAHHHLAESLPADLEGRDLVVTGVIDSLPYRFDGGQRFNFTVEAAHDASGAPSSLPPRLALGWYDPRDTTDGQGAPKLEPGERWQFTLRLRRPHGNANPDGFDYEVWLLEQNLRATGAVRDGDGNRRLAAFVPGFGTVVERCRGWLRDRIEAALRDKAYAEVIVALVIGDQRGIAQSDWKVFNRTGIGHLVSISGLHITMVAGMVAALMGALWRRSFFTDAQLPLLLPAQKAAVLAGALTAFVYVLLAGFGVPAQRTLYMIGTVAIALWSGRIMGVSQLLCAALFVVLVLDPWAVLWPGFWLSFGAVAMLLYAGVGRAGQRDAPTRIGRLRQRMLGACRTQYAVTVGLVPLTLLLFGQVSLVSPLANAVAIPLVSFVVTPLSLLGSVLPAPLSQWTLLAAHWLVECLARFLGWLSALPPAVWSTPLPAWWMFLLALLGTIWLLAPRGWPARWLGMATWMPLLLHQPGHPERGFEAIAFDIGQGNAVLIETRHHRLLYDTGPVYSPESDAGERVILPYLRARGIAALDAMVVSHSDADHSGGALSVLDELKVDWVTTSLEPDNPVVRASPWHRRCLAGQSWEWEGVRFEMLHPPAGLYADGIWKTNAHSCTLKVSYGAQSLLLPGDIEAPQEALLLATMPEKLQSTVLLAPHHGSGTSSTPEFLDTVAPEVAIFQVGYRNRYRHPKPEVFERYAQRGIRRMRSDRDGAVLLRFDGELWAEAWRGLRKRYWQE